MTLVICFCLFYNSGGEYQHSEPVATFIVSGFYKDKIKRIIALHFKSVLVNCLIQFFWFLRIGMILAITTLIVSADLPS